MTVASTTSGSSYATLHYSSQQNNPPTQTSSAQSGRTLPSSSGSSGNHPTPVSPVVSRVKRNDTDPPSSSSDDYANYVQRIGQQSPLSQAQLDNVRWGTVRAVEASRSRLVDPHTTDMIGNTILHALNRSPTFRALVSYGMNHGGERLDDIMYRNEYELHPELQSQNEQIGDLTIDELRTYYAEHTSMPIAVNSEAFNRRNGQGPYVNLCMAPNEGSPHLPEWREVLIHELAHQLADSDDPPEAERQNRLGPTEILARRVAQEMGWPIPDLTAYDAPERHAYIDEHEDGTVLEAAERNGGHQRAFFQRLDTISAHNDASPDFHELEDVPVQATAQNHTYDFAPIQAVNHNHTYGLSDAQPQGDLGQMEFHYGEPSLFTFAHSASIGAPGGFQSAYGASSASWATQGRFFQYGNPVDGNPHVREFDFPDGSKVIATAHQPQFADSDRTKFEKTLTVGGGAVAGAVVGFVAGGGPFGAVAGAGAGAAGAGWIASTYPQDRVWQGYTLNYYNKGDSTPFYTQYMYAWDSDWNRVGSLAKQKDSSMWPDYGDGNPDGSWDWWGWKSGNSPART